MDNLHSIFNNKNVVSSYVHRNPKSVFKVNSFEEEELEKKNIKKHYIEDEIFEELANSCIVEEFQMVDQNDEEPEKVYRGRAEYPTYREHNILGSSSDNNVPSRKSSMSSLSSNENILKKCIRNSSNHFKTNNQFAYFVPEVIPNGEMSQQEGGAMEMESEKSVSNKQHRHKAQSNRHPEQMEANSPNVEARKKNSNNFQHAKELRRGQIDSNREKFEKQEKINKIQQIGCNCKKSKCLKMYCECFNLQIFCGPNCNCIDCGNGHPNGDHQKAVLDALVRNPKAFTGEQKESDAMFTLGVKLAEVKKGCKCRKTKCQKKYCQCFHSGQPCGKFCKCQGCENGY